MPVVDHTPPARRGLTKPEFPDEHRVETRRQHCLPDQREPTAP
ncbi:hypothetical protein ACIA5E_29465 [Nocardia asteroides]